MIFVAERKHTVMQSLSVMCFNYNIIVRIYYKKSKNSEKK